MRISERNEKEKTKFLFFHFRTKVSSAEPKIQISERNEKEQAEGLRHLSRPVEGFEGTPACKAGEGVPGCQ